MTTILLVRHATCDPVGRSIAGRARGIALNAAGRAQAERLAERLVEVDIAAVYSGPLERAVETAAAIAAHPRRPMHIVASLDELDYGEWTGRDLASLETDPRWRRYNAFRSFARVPGGELMIEAQARAVAALAAIAVAHRDETVVVVSHADIIRAVILHVRGMALDRVHELDVPPASITTLELGDDSARLEAVGDTAHLADAAQPVAARG